MTVRQFTDVNQRMVPAVLCDTAIAKTYDATISGSTTVTLNSATKLIEVSAVDKGIFLKWGGTASNTDFDGFVPANSSKMFGVPPSQTSVQFIEEAASAHLVVLEF